MLRPLGDLVLIRRIEEESDSELIIPDVAKVQSNKGKIVAVGSEVNGLRAGETVLFSKFGEMPVNVDGEELLLVHAPEIYGAYELEVPALRRKAS